MNLSMCAISRSVVDRVCDSFSLLLPSPPPVMDNVGMTQEKEGEEMMIDPEKEVYYASDPKQALRKFFEREGEVFALFCVVLCGYTFLRFVYTFLSIVVSELPACTSFLVFCRVRIGVGV